MTESRESADIQWRDLADLGEKESQELMANRYRELATLPEEERVSRLTEMERAVYELPEEKIRSFSITRLRVWLDLEQASGVEAKYVGLGRIGQHQPRGFEQADGRRHHRKTIFPTGNQAEEDEGRAHRDVADFLEQEQQRSIDEVNDRCRADIGHRCLRAQDALHRTTLVGKGITEQDHDHRHRTEAFQRREFTRQEDENVGEVLDQPDTPEIGCRHPLQQHPVNDAPGRNPGR